MKTFKTSFFGALAAFLFSLNLSAQFRIDPSGHVGMGTYYPNPGYKCHVKGDLLLTSYPDIPAPNSTFVEFQMKVAAGFPGIVMGTNVGKTFFWSPEWGYNSVYAQNFYLSSDSSLKTNITRVNEGFGMEKILQLKPYSYRFKTDAKSKNKSFGFLAQEVEQVLPDITTTIRGVKLIDYVQIIPLLVDAAQEQNKTIENLKKEVQDLKDELSSCCNKSQANNPAVIPSQDPGSGILYQNMPNPFSDKTTIAYQINTSMNSASILVFDMQGTLKKAFQITGGGKGEITINGNELAAGMYLYSLIVDGRETDTKRMILNN
ncbi:MAG: tail fiber domain-containing protein [Bacteroidia bacterium]